MADTPKQPSSVAENVLNKTADVSGDAFNMATAALKDGANQTADVSSTAIKAATATMEMTDDAAKSVQDQTAKLAQVSNEADDQVMANVRAFAERGTQTLTAYSEAGKQATAAFSDVSQAWAEVHKRQVSDFTELSQQAMRLRTPQDLVAFQSLATERAQDQLALMKDAYSRAFSAIARVWQPVRTDSASLAA